MRVTRREMLLTTASAAALPPVPVQAAAPKYTRYDVTSDAGKAMLKSYALAVEKMAKLPPAHPHNWFRNAFVHFMDCPHGNWWFYVWHRGYVGFFEQTVRALSGNPNFAFPYWDWTKLAEIPSAMFDATLTPVNDVFRPYTKDLDTFTSYIKGPLEDYWNTLGKPQRQQLDMRGYTSFDLLWNDVTGYDPGTGKIVPGNQAFAATDRARYLSRENPKFDQKTKDTCLPSVIQTGLSPTQFYNKDVALSFTSSKTPSHNTMNGTPQFSLLEGQPHNKIHNYIGGVGPWNPGPYGNMTNFLSPVDPIFFLHHANMDRLWDVWTRKQQKQGLPILPTDATELKDLRQEPFLFFVRADGTFVKNGKAGDYLHKERFEYDYGPATEQLETLHLAAKLPPSLNGTIASGVGSVDMRKALAGPAVATVTLARPADPSAPREYDLLVNAPNSTAEVGADSPFYAGTIAFFGPAMHGMTHEATFALSLPQRPQAVAALNAPDNARATKLEFRLVPTYDRTAPAPAITALTLRAF